MEATVRETLLSRFKQFLDSAPIGPATDEEADDAAGEARDLYAIFIEMAALRTEVRTETRLVKTALDQFREVFDTLRGGHAAVERELSATRAEAKERERAALKPLLLDFLDVRDGLAAALKLPAASARLSWRERLSGRRATSQETWRDGLAITLRRCDQALLDRRVTRMETLGRSLDPRSARVLATVDAPGRNDGIVVEEIRTGFLWDERVLRPAEVVVSKSAASPDPDV